MFVHIPVFLIDPVFLPVKIQLIHPKYHRLIFGLPLLLVRITIFHSDLSHNAAASRIVPIISQSLSGVNKTPFQKTAAGCIIATDEFDMGGQQGKGDGKWLWDILRNGIWGIY